MTKEEALNYILEASSDKNKAEAFTYVRFESKVSNDFEGAFDQQELDEKLNG